MITFRAHLSTIKNRRKFEAKNLDEAFQKVSSLLPNEGDVAQVYADNGNLVHVITRKNGAKTYGLPNFTLNNFPKEITHMIGQLPNKES